MIDNIASTRSRIGAMVVDTVVFLPMHLLDKRMSAGEASQEATFIYFLMTWQLGWLYTTVLHGWRGQTVGKALFAVRVVRADNLGRLGWSRSALRDLPIIALVVCASAVWVYWNAAFFAGQGSEEIDRWANQLFDILTHANVLWLLLEVVTMMTHPQRRALHDLFAGSVVVKV